MFITEEAFLKKISIFYTKFSSYPSAKYKKFIDEKLIMKREKSIAFYTRLTFTVGRTSSQRSESMNYLFKGFRLFKKEMSQWNIYQLMTGLDRCVEHIYKEIFLEI